MKIPVSEQISLNVMSVLATINRANGYAFDLIPERVKKSNNKRHLLAVFDDTDRPADYLPQSQGVAHQSWDLVIEVHILPDSEDETPIASYLNLIESDFRRALMDDPKRGGWAIDTKFDDQADTLTNSKDEILGLALHFQVNFRFQVSDPSKL